MSQRPETSDSAFLWSKFIAANNNELLANLGNFVNRVCGALLESVPAEVQLQVIKFVNAKYDSVIPGPKDFEGGQLNLDNDSPFAKTDSDFVTDINARLTEYRSLMDATKLRNGLFTAMSVSGRGNQYLQDAGLDNALLTNQPERCAEVLLYAINLIYLLSVVLQPFMPTTSDHILRQLNTPARSLPTRFSIDILPGHTLGKAEHLFKKIDNVNGEQEKKWQKRFGGDALLAEKVDPAGPEGHPEGGAVPHVAEITIDKRAQKEARKQQMAMEKRAATTAAAQNKSPEEKDLEARIEVLGKLVAGIRTGKMEGDAAEVQASAKSLKAELTELRKRLLEAPIA